MTVIRFKIWVSTHIIPLIAFTLFINNAEIVRLKMAQDLSLVKLVNTIPSMPDKSEPRENSTHKVLAMKNLQQQRINFRRQPMQSFKQL